MGKTRPSKKDSSSKKSKKSKGLSAASSLSSNPLASKPSDPTPPPPVDQLLITAQALLDQLQFDDAYALALQTTHLYPNSAPAHSLLATTLLDLDPPQPEAAFAAYTTAASLDPTNPQYLLWAAQLHPDGGAGSVPIIEKACEILRGKSDDESRGLLTSALCSCAEVYMSDLCMEPDAEQRCERYVNEALLISPSSCEALVTLASVRISQTRVEEAKGALLRAREAVLAERGEDGSFSTAFSVRVGLARLLVEVEELETAVEVVEELVAENDQLVDLWYLGGWAMFLIGEKLEGGVGKGGEEEVKTKEEAWTVCRDWLGRCLKLVEVLEWEDEGIEEHAREVMAKVVAVVGEAEEKEEEEEEGEVDEGEWESEDEDMED